MEDVDEAGGDEGQEAGELQISLPEFEVEGVGSVPLDQEWIAWLEQQTPEGNVEGIDESITHREPQANA